MAGILLADCFRSHESALWKVVLVVACIAVLCLGVFLIKKSSRLYALFGVAVMLLFMDAGMVVYLLDAKSKHVEWSSEKEMYVATLTDVPEEKEKTVFVPAQVSLLSNDSVAPQTVYLYFKYSYWANELKIGDRVCFVGTIKPPKNAGNPDEFDYERYLYIKGVSGTVYLPTGQWRKVGESTPTLRTTALAFRKKLLERYKELGFTGNEFAVLSALTLGYKKELSDDLKNDYSVAGASHVLALSGLHLGILYMILSFILPPFSGRRRAWLKEICIVAVLWAFAFVVGLSPSVIRAATLFTLLSIGRSLSHDGSSVNSLAIAATVMLLASPRYLFDVSFQLSFLAVLSIILFHPIIYRWIKPISNRILRYFWGIISVSLAAQIGTAPLVMYYFSTFSLYFLLTNLLVIPLAFLILVLTVTMWVLELVPFLQAGVAWLLVQLIRFTNELLGGISALPLSSVELSSFGIAEVILTYLIVFFLSLWLIKRWTRALPYALACVALFGVVRLLPYFPLEQTPYILFYNSKDCPAVQLVYSSDESYLLSPETDSVIPRLKYVAHNYWRKHKMQSPYLLPEIYKDEHVTQHWGIVSFQGKQLCLLNDASWSHLRRSELLPLDYLYVCKGFKGRLPEVMKTFSPKLVVLDASLGTIRLRSLKKDCATLCISCIDLSENGALKVEF